MYTVKKSIDIDFAHHVAGHDGACINIHGHTWKFEVELSSRKLDGMGFVVDFKRLKTLVLEPVHTLLDHSLALASDTLIEIEPSLELIGEVLLKTRGDTLYNQTQLKGGDVEKTLGYKHYRGSLEGASNLIIGGLKCVSFPFSPTSERLAKWLWQVATNVFTSESGIESVVTSICETLHPVESVASYRS